MSVSINTFWQVIEGLNWATWKPEQGFLGLKGQIVTQVGRENVEAFHAWFRVAVESLYLVSNDLVPGGYYTDNWDNAITHTIGLGRQAYREAFDHPSVLVTRHQNRDYHDSFLFVVPSEGDPDLSLICPE